METKHRESGEVNKTDEVAVYEVKDGKIVKEKFYYSE
jgi:ketosteroid isomerase-like protein